MKKTIICIGLFCFVLNDAQAVEWPLKRSENRHYLVDQNEVPFYIIGETIWRIMANIPSADYDLLLDNIVDKGFSAVGVNALGFGTEWWDGGNFDESYFQKLDLLVKKCRHRNLLFIGKTVNKSKVDQFSPSDCRRIGLYLGNRYKESNEMGNYVFCTGLDGGGDNPRWEQIALGILDSNPKAIISHHDGRGRSSCDVWGLKSWLTLNAVYTHHPPWWRPGQPYPYAETWDNWNKVSHCMPLMAFEAVYEKEHMPAGNTVNMRKQHWWLVTSGNVNGHFYGHADIYQFSSGWKKTIQNAEFRNQLIHMRAMFDTIKWWKLIPDTDNGLVLVGNKGSNATRVTASLAVDRTFALLYTPEGNDPVVDMSKFCGQVTAKWYNPSNGGYEPSVGPYNNSRLRTFSTPSNSHDWVLLLLSKQALRQ